MGALAVDTGRALMVYPPPETCDGYAPPELLPRTLAEVRLAVLPCLFTAGKGGGGGCHPLVSPLTKYLYLKCASENQLLTPSTTYTLPDSKCFDLMVSSYACFAFPAGTLPRPAERGFRSLPYSVEATASELSGRCS